MAYKAPVLKKLKNALLDIKNKSNATPTDIKISENVSKILKKIEVVEEGRFVAKSAAAMGLAKSAQARIQQTMREVELSRTLPKGHALPAIKLVQDTLNPVAVRVKEAAVVKEKSGGLDAIAGRMCEQFHFPEAVVPSTTATLQGTIEILPKAPEGEVRQSEKREGEHTLVVQPLVERPVDFGRLMSNPALMREIFNRLDREDFQKKAIMQGMLAASDLHPGNALVQPIVNTEYLKCEEKSWEYQTKAGHWIKVTDFTQLVTLYLSKSIDNTTKVRNDPKDTEGHIIQSDTTLQKALTVQWQIVFFDNDQVLGNCLTGSKGNHNHLQNWRGQAVLPIRSFLLGLQQSNEPLQPEVKEWILQECQGAALTEKEKMGFEGHHALWRNFSPSTQKELRDFMKTISYSESMLFGGSKGELLRQLPQTLAMKMYQDLLKHKKTHRQEDLQDVMNFVGTEIREGLNPLNHLEGAIKGELNDPSANFGTFSKELQRLNDYIKAYEKGGEIITPHFAQLVSQCAGALYKSEAFKKLTSEHQSMFRDFFNNEKEGLLKKAEKMDYCVLLERGLFPQIDPQENKAVIERAANAARYINTCNDAGLSPTVSGVHNAMFPYFNRFIDLLTATESYRLGFDQLKGALCSQPHIIIPQVLEGLKKEKLRFETAGDRAQVEKINTSSNQIETMHAFLQKMAALDDPDKWGIDHDGNWSDAQIKELLGLLEVCAETVQKNAGDKDKKEWNELLEYHKSMTTRAAKGLKAKKEGSVYAVKLLRDRILEQVLVAGFSSQGVPSAVIRSIASLQQESAPINQLRTQILLEIHAVAGGKGYSVIPCQRILDDALQQGLFPGGENDSQYKELKKAVDEAMQS